MADENRDGPSKRSAKLSLWREQARRVIRPLGVLALPGWLILALSWGKEVHFVISLLEKLHLAGFLREWGWLIGAVWIVAMVAWEVRKPPRTQELERVRAMERLGPIIKNAVVQFEDLCRAYELSISPGNTAEVRSERRKFFLAIEVVLWAALETVPENQRRDYRNMLWGVAGDYLAWGRPTLFSIDLPPTLPIERALRQDETGMPP